MKKIYVQLNPNNRIVDCITFPYEDYVELEVGYIPKDIMSGAYKLEDGNLVFHPELLPDAPLLQRVELLEEAVNFVIMGGTF